MHSWVREQGEPVRRNGVGNYIPVDREPNDGAIERLCGSGRHADGMI